MVTAYVAILRLFFQDQPHLICNILLLQNDAFLRALLCWGSWGNLHSNTPLNLLIIYIICSYMNCIIFCRFQLCKLLCLPMYTTNISMKSAFSQKKRPNLFFLLYVQYRCQRFQAWQISWKFTGIWNSRNSFAPLTYNYKFEIKPLTHWIFTYVTIKYTKKRVWSWD